MTLRMAFAGCGYIAKVHARAAGKVEGVELAAVANHRPESMAAFANEFGIGRRYGTVEEMLAGGGIDALVVSTPNYLHSPQAIAGLEAGVHVMVEKPMARNAAEAKEMVAAGQRSGALLMVAHCWRFDQEARWVREQVAAGRIGQVIRTKGCGVHVNWGPSGWFTHKREAGGGAVADMGIHAIDTARFLMGDPLPVSVYARIGTYYRQIDVDDTGVIAITWDNGAVSIVEAGWWQPYADGPNASTQLYGRKGTAFLFPTRLVLANEENQQLEQVDSQFPAVRENHYPQAMYDAQMAYFVDCVRANRTPVPGGVEGWINMQIVDAVYKSSRTGAVVKTGG
ncbi:MAG: Gfo/Idh/MocA family oxidoreductase [Anaerolineae bacterium]|nr:Gfo/Idh/MocA family oxidoreductase [Anaerolineae bacterium]